MFEFLFKGGVLILAIIGIVSLTEPSSDEVYRNGYLAGSSEKYNVGYSDGYADGHSDGYYEACEEFSFRDASESSTRSLIPYDSEIVYVTRTGDKYHKSGCSYLKSKIEMTLSDAIQEGYTACSRCY